MTKRQLTDQSSPADVAEAQRQLSDAQQDLSRFIEASRNDPTLPRDIDPITGEDFGPLITPPLIDNVGKRIANRYDYIEYGGQSQTETVTDDGPLQINITGKKFYIRGSTNVNSQLGRNYFEIESETQPTQTTTADLQQTSIVQPEQTTTADPAQPTQIVASGTTTADPAQPTQIVASGTTTAQPATSQSIGNIQNPSLPARSNTIYGNVPISDQFDNADLGDYSPDPSIPGAANRPPADGIISENNDDSGRPDTTGATAPGYLGDGTRGVNNDDTGIDDVRPNTGDGTVNDNSSPGDSNNDLDRLDLVPGSTPLGGTAIGGTAGASIATLANPSLDTEGVAQEANKRVPQPNKLHSISNWSYELALYLIDPANWNSIANGSTIDSSILTNLMMKSGGHGGKSVLNPKKDYYIDNLEFSAAVGQSAASAKNSTEYNIKFQIIEPYGVALLAEIIGLCRRKNIEDHVQAPYLLEIKFNGYNSTTGKFEKNIEGTGPKYIPIKFISFDFSIDSAATTYTIEAMPYAHYPLVDEATRSLNQDIDIQGATYNELISEVINKINQDEQKSADELGLIPDEYEYVITDPDMANAKVGYDDITVGSAVRLSKQSWDADGKDKEKVSVHNGSTVKDTLANLLLATDYPGKFNTTDQPGSQANPTDPFKLLKIIPTVEFKTSAGGALYDIERKRYVRKITYKIEKQSIYGVSLPGAPSAPVDQIGWSKEYEWIFTGKNADILDFKVEFNLDYFNQITAFGIQKATLNETPSIASGSTSSANGTKVDEPMVPGKIARYKKINDEMFPDRDAATLRASDFMDNLLNQPRANQLQIDMDIVGDPDYIIQDYSILPRGNSPSTTAPYRNGSLATDVNDIIVNLKFVTPRDYDPIVGQMNLETERTFIQGKYRLMFVNNKFSNGEFTQNIELIRVTNQLANDGLSQPILNEEQIRDEDELFSQSLEINPENLNTVSQAEQLQEDFEDISETRPNTTPTVNNITLEMENALQILSTDLSPETVRNLENTIPENTGISIRRNLVRAIDNYYTPEELVEASSSLTGDDGFSPLEIQGAADLLELRSKLSEGL